MNQLGNGLHDADQHEDALTVREAELAMKLRLGMPARQLLVVRGNIANSYQMLRRYDEALRMRREVYSGTLRICGEDSYDALVDTLNLALALRKTGNKPEAKELLRARIPVAERSLGRENYVYFRLRWTYAKSLADAADATLDDVVQAEALLDDTYTRFRRVMGDRHPDTPRIHEILLAMREALSEVLARAPASLHA